MSQLIKEYLGLHEQPATALAPAAGTVLAILCQSVCVCVCVCVCVRRGEQIFELLFEYSSTQAGSNYLILTLPLGPSSPQMSHPLGLHLCLSQ